MSNTTWGVKLDENLKEKLTNAMRESGMEGQAFIDQLYTLYVAQALKETKPEMAGTLTELQSITKRIYEIYLNSSQQSDNLIKTKEESFQLKLNELMEKNNALENKIVEKEKKEKTYEENYKILAAEKSKVDLRNKEILGSNCTLEDLISQYKQKNNTLGKELSECETYKEDNQALNEKLRVLEKKFNDQELELKKECISTSSKTKEIADITKASEAADLAAKKAAEIERTNNIKNIESISAKALLDKGNSLLIKDQNHQKIIAELTEKYNSQIETYNSKKEISNDKLNDKLDIEKELNVKLREINFKIINENETLKTAAANHKRKLMLYPKKR